MRIAVAGGTGTVGRQVVRETRARGHEVVVLARSEGVDLVTGTGLAERLSGTDAVVDVTNVTSQSRRKATAFFDQVTRRLAAAERQAAVGHHVVLSIVGIDAVPLGYYRAKLAQERDVAGGPVPWTIQRCTQFHELVEQMLRVAAVGPYSFVPQVQTQTIAATEVAAILVDLAEAGPAGRVPDLAGPERHDARELAHRLNDVRGLGRRIVGVRLPGRAGRAMREGGLLPTTEGPRGTTTFEEWLAAGPS